MKTSKTIEKVNDGWQYFISYRFEELKEDDVYYIKAFMSYIDILEKSLLKTRNELKKANEVLSS